MDELRRWYREGLAARLQALEAAGVAAGPDDDAAEPVSEIAIALKASGATYGFAEISAAAERLLQAGEPDRAAARGALAAELRRVIEAGARERHGIVVVEPDLELARQLAERLRPTGRPVLTVSGARQLQAALDEQDFVAIVLDIVLPDADGRHVLARLQEEPSTAAVPVLVLSTPAGKGLRGECERLGAAGFFVKPDGLDALVSAVESEVLRQGGADADARVDPATGGANRAAVRDGFEAWTARAGAAVGPLSIAVIEVTAATEGVFRAAAERLGRALAPATVARWEGNELVALLEGNDRRAAEGRLQRARAGLRSWAGAPPGAAPISLSAGVVQVARGATLDQALLEAGRLRDTARRMGGDRIESDETRAAGPRRIAVLAEDDPVMVVLVKHLLARDGFDVMHFGDGRSALEAVPTAGASVVVLDVMMPQMDGFTVLERLRARRDLDGLPIVMLTTVGSEKDVARGLQLGADDYIVKPFSPEDLVARVRRVVRAAEQRGAAARLE